MEAIKNCSAKCLNLRAEFVWESWSSISLHEMANPLMKSKKLMMAKSIFD